MSARQRRKGIRFEQKLIRMLLDIFPEAKSARSESRNRDAKGIDICDTPGYAIQCKSTSRAPQYHRLIQEMRNGDDEIPVVVHEYTQKANANFVVQGRYAILPLEDFLGLLKDLQDR